MLLDEIRQRQDVVVDENDALAGRARDAGVAALGKSRVRLFDHGERDTSPALARAR